MAKNIDPSPPFFLGLSTFELLSCFIVDLEWIKSTVTDCSKMGKPRVALCSVPESAAYIKVNS